FKNFTIKNTDWDGTFKKSNIIYAPNGSGKTSLSLIFESLKGNDELLLKKKNFDSSESPEIVFMDEDNKQVKYTNGKWNKEVKKIEVFNNFYLEDNIYKIAFSDYEVTDSILNSIFDLTKLEILKEEIKAHKREY